MWEAPNSTQGKSGTSQRTAEKLRRFHRTAPPPQRSDGHARPASRRGVSALPGEAARRILHTLHVWRERVRARNELSRLDERSLRDIGLTAADREFLVNKPFWRE